MSGSLNVPSASSPKISRLPLEGLRVADFTWIGAGSFTTKILADMGADVIKIESGQRVDNLRVSPPFKDGKPGVNRSGYFADRNSSKRSITVNLKSPEGLDLVKRLIAQCDMVTNNFSPGTMEKLGLGYDVVRALREDIIYISMSMQGSTGPASRTVGFGVTIGALTGLQFLSGEPDREPVGTGTHYPDHIPNPAHAAFALLAALRHRRRTGMGQFIDLAQTEPMAALLAPALIESAINGTRPMRAGNANGRAAPRGFYPVAGSDRWLAISVASDAQWANLVIELGDPALAAAEWREQADRIADRAALDKAIGEATQRLDGWALMHRLQELGIAAGMVQNAADLIDEDPQLAHRNHWRRLEHPEMGLSLYNGQPFALRSVDVGPRRAAPLLGEHTAEVCAQFLGLDEAAVADLSERGVLT
jgi:benzylsuccinate CoA-transferase BbsF subunit